MRRTIVQALILLQNRGLIDRLQLFPTLFKLLGLQDKALRSLVFSHIVNDVKRLNRKKVPGYVKLNHSLQNFVSGMLGNKPSSAAATAATTTDSSAASSSATASAATASKKALDILVDLWRRKLWNDERTVAAVEKACFHLDTKVKVTALRFFLGLSFYEEEELEEEEEEKHTIRAKLSVTKGAMKGVVKKRKKREREMARAQKKVSREDGKKGHSSVVTDCPAIFLLHDPQTFAERLFSALRKSNEAFAVRMLMMNVISRLVGAHQLVLLNFYPFLQRYMQPHQKNVTHILTYLAQASHPLVPPDVLAPCVKTLANHFVTDRSTPEVTAVGINAIREICARAPLVMDSDLLWDLVQYKKSKNKGIMMASRSLIALFRDINPNLLRRKDRGRDGAMNAKELESMGMDVELEFGRDAIEKVRTDIVGAELLAIINSKKGDDDDDDDEEGDGGNNKAMEDEDEWNIAVGNDNDSDEDEDDSDEEDHGTSTKEINDFLRAVEAENRKGKGSETKGGKKNAAAAADNKKQNGNKKGKKQPEEDEEEDDEDEEEGSEMEIEMNDDDDDAEADEEDEEEEDGEDDEEEEDEDEEEEDGEEEDEEEEEEDEDAPPSKKQKTNTTKSDAKSSQGEEEKKPSSSLPIGATRIFTPKDFEQLRVARLKAAMNGPSANRKRKRSKDAEDEEEDDEGDDHGAAGLAAHQRERSSKVGEVVDAESIIGWVAKKRRTKEERLAKIFESRTDGVNAKKKGGGSTNLEKERAKPFQLVKHAASVRSKKQRSFSQQQQTFSKHISNMKKAGKKIKTKMKRRKSSKMRG